MEETLNVTKYPDSLEMDFGGTRKGGKVYFNASDKKEAQERISNMKEIALHAEKQLAEFREQIVKQTKSSEEVESDAKD